MARLLVPPIIGIAARRLRGRARRGEWEYVGPLWASTKSLRGWNVATVVAAQSARWPDLQSIASTPTKPIASDVSAHNTYMSFGYVVGLTASGLASISMLDWGGGLGQYGMLVHALYPALAVDYHCHDLPLMVERGRELLPSATFHEDDTETFGRSYDLVMASSSLHYVEGWREKLSQLAGAAQRYLYVTRLPIATNNATFVLRQKAARHGYGTEYQSWVLNRADVLAVAEENGLQLRREFTIDEGMVVPGAPEAIAYRGFLFGRPA